MKLLLVSFDSTVKANLTVGPPCDYHCYTTESRKRGNIGRIEADIGNFQHVSEGWGYVEGSVEEFAEVRILSL